MSKKLRIFKGRSSKGIKGIELGEKDKVISLSIVDNKDSFTYNLKHYINQFTDDIDVVRGDKVNIDTIVDYPYVFMFQSYLRNQHISFMFTDPGYQICGFHRRFADP